MTHDMPHLAEFIKFLDSLNKESDRGGVLIAATMVDDLLERIITSFLLDHTETEKLVDGFNAPLGTLSARSLAAHALGLVSAREYAEIGTIRKIRNRFAHDIHVSFDDQQIKDLCRNLTYRAQDSSELVVNTKDQFTTAATSLILSLTNRPHYVSMKRLVVQDLY
jgi:mannitol operon repressor